MPRGVTAVPFELICLFAGSIAIAGVSICYVLSPPAAALPLAPLDLGAAIEGARSGKVSMHLISAVGIPGDVLFAAATLLVAIKSFSASRPIEAMGWTLASLGTLVFLLADSIVGTVLPQIAIAGAPQAFMAAKSIFDLFFIAGTFVFGLGAVLTMAPNLRRRSNVPVALAWPIMLSGVGNIVSASAALAGANVPQAMGLTIGIDAALYTLFAAVLVKRTPLPQAYAAM
jgi:hypothetical protein